MVQVRWTTAALEDLSEVHDYNRQFSVKYAEQLIERLIDRTDTLTQYPRLGRVVPEYGESAVRELWKGVIGLCTKL